MKAFLEKYNSLKYLLYFFVAYMIGFMILENQSFSHMMITDSWIDQYIPFNEYFVIPYLLWFVFMVLGFAYFVFIDQSGVKRTYFYLFLGMSLSLLIYAVIPTGQNLRVQLYDENIFQCLVSFIYSIDSSTNVCPSIHVYNSVMMCVSLLKSQRVQQTSWLCVALVILTLLICMSTVMIKQHAFIDIIWALILAVIIYCVGKWKYDY
ncbi:hypothetical protein NMU03_04265 [Allocoprobacillus halotolerans]|uniref:Phosphatidic acid phosphatase type 2/haloperoxidase domain-containing protein n=1 Tax=Allocoprobacillus halotolerans TaxID=2944914 RepID=A0ABY5I3Y5_9FIRM|nr:hypothetical protein [Allocoprobacillus halotolerans]UTY40026.1 hypothetical protein NMU03_04265 [Allocoprobacillus halotolerans]